MDAAGSNKGRMAVLAVLVAVAVAGWVTWPRRTPVPDVTVDWKRVLAGDVLYDADGLPVDPGALEGKFVGVYFSALNCAPCQKFTPDLVRFHYAHSKEFIIVFVSSDVTEEEKYEYMRRFRMPWLTLSLRGPGTGMLAGSLQVRTIPYLAVLSPQGKLLTVDGRIDIEKNAKGAFEEWKALAE